jgi:putative glycosyltransferase (TIGR04348 family)
MRIGIATPAPAGSSHGNRITAIRWASILKKLGHRVSISQTFQDEPLDLLVALHARRSYQSIKRFRQQHPLAPIVVTLTGTDLYRDLPRDQKAKAALEMATRIVALQPRALQRLKPTLKTKAQVIFQSVEARPRPAKTRAKEKTFDVCVIGHLRMIKDPFRAALASRLLPSSSRIRILQVGAAMSAAMAKRAQSEARRNPRYQWLGEMPRARVLGLVAKSQCCVLSSRMEGGANVLSEAIVAGVPVLASRIDGNVGILGADYPGLFPFGDTRALADLLQRVERGPGLLERLRRRIKILAPLFDRKKEERAWADLIRGLS